MSEPLLSANQENVKYNVIDSSPPKKAKFTWRLGPLFVSDGQTSCCSNEAHVCCSVPSSGTPRGGLCCSGCFSL